MHVSGLLCVEYLALILWWITGSDILYFTSWGQPHIVINSAQVASELLEKKSSLYSDRWAADYYHNIKS